MATDTIPTLKNTSQASVFVSFVLLIVSFQYNQYQILTSSYIFLFLGLSFMIIDFFNKNDKMKTNIFISFFLVVLIISFNIYILFKYKDKIENNEVSPNYYSLSTASKILLIAIMSILISSFYYPYTNIKASIMLLLVAINVIINTIQIVILKDFVTDG